MASDIVTGSCDTNKSLQSEMFDINNTMPPFILTSRNYTWVQVEEIHIIA